MKNRKQLDLIDRNALIEKSYFSGKLPDPGHLYPEGKEVVDVDDIEDAPRIDAVEVVHGRWEPHPEANGFERCSVCHDCIIYDDWVEEPKWYYCPNCGADMR